MPQSQDLAAVGGVLRLLMVLSLALIVVCLSHAYLVCLVALLAPISPDPIHTCDCILHDAHSLLPPASSQPCARHVRRSLWTL
jgi:hypothetical protein